MKVPKKVSRKGFVIEAHDVAYEGWLTGGGNVHGNNVPILLGKSFPDTVATAEQFKKHWHFL